MPETRYAVVSCINAGLQGAESSKSRQIRLSDRFLEDSAAMLNFRKWPH